MGGQSTVRTHEIPRPYQYYTDRLEGSEIKKYKFVAHCTSYQCTKTYEFSSVVKPDAKKTDSFCSECGHAIFWERI